MIGCKRWFQKYIQMTLRTLQGLLRYLQSIYCLMTALEPVLMPFDHSA